MRMMRVVGTSSRHWGKTQDQCLQVVASLGPGATFLSPASALYSCTSETFRRSPFPTRLRPSLMTEAIISLVPSEDLGGVPGGTALLLDEERCVRCALCIERCPPNALSMGMWSGVGVPSFAGSNPAGDAVPVALAGAASGGSSS